MDIELLSRMVKELVLDNDVVTLPGVGAFVVESVPSTFSDKGYTVNPPYRRLVFRQREEADGLLVDMYAKANDIDVEAAGAIMGQFLESLKADLESKKTIVFPALGRLRATKQNSFFFVADEDLDIDPEGFGLRPVSLKTHVETEDEVAEAVASLRNILDVPQPEPERQQVPVEPQLPAEPAAAEEPAPQISKPAPQIPEPAAAETPAPQIPEPAAQPEPEKQPKPVSQPVPEKLADQARAAGPSIPEPANPKPSNMAGKELPSTPAEPRPKFKKTTRPRRKLRMAGRVILVVLLTLLLIAVAYMLLGRAGLLDAILFNEEELQVLNHQFTIL